MTTGGMYAPLGGGVDERKDSFDPGISAMWWIISSRLEVSRWHLPHTRFVEEVRRVGDGG